MNYTDHNDIKEFSVPSTLNAAALAFAIGGSLISLVNIFGEGFSSKKQRLENDYFNLLRNLLTSFTFVLTCMLNASEARDNTRIVMWLMVGQRMLDMCLDVDTPWTLVCDNMKSLEEDVVKNSSMLNGGLYLMKQILVILCFIGTLVFQGIYAGVHNLGEEETGDDEIYQYMIFGLVGLHLALVLLSILIENVASVKESFINCLTNDKPDCGDGHTVFGLNSVPLVTKAVFTANLFFLSCLAGEHIEDNQNVGWLIYSAIAIAVADIVARNII
tara:strand:+ start:15366 stop:16184 length:819 start_codon:yes stop_codon:yes gene_type:complete